jgi:hypothetical protein
MLQFGAAEGVRLLQKLKDVISSSFPVATLKFSVIVVVGVVEPTTVSTRIACPVAPVEESQLPLLFVHVDPVIAGLAESGAAV